MKKTILLIGIAYFALSPLSLHAKNKNEHQGPMYYSTKAKNKKSCKSESLVKKEESSKVPFYKRIFNPENQKRTLSTMGYEELLEAKNASLAKKDTFTAIKYLERMSKVCEDFDSLRTILLELADLMFEDKKFSKAILLYDQYIKSYPGRKEDYTTALYKKILCSFYQVLPNNRDQSMSEKTIELCNTFLKECLENKYVDEVESIRTVCEKKCARHELYIANHYTRQNKIISAKTRLANVRNKYITIPDIEPELLVLEISFADKVGNIKFAQEKRLELSKKFPEHESVILAQNKKIPNMARKF